MTRRRLLLTTTAWAVFSLGLWMSDAEPAVLVLGSIFWAGAVALCISIDHARTVSPVEWPEPRPFTSTGHSSDQRVVRILRETYGSVWSDSTKLRDTLVELVDDRLLAHHGIDRASSPNDAATVLSPSLQRLVTRPRTTARVGTLRQILTDIEKL